MIPDAFPAQMETCLYLQAVCGDCCWPDAFFTITALYLCQGTSEMENIYMFAAATSINDFIPTVDL